MHPHFFDRQSQSSILAFAEGDVNGDYTQDYVYVVGQQSSDSPYSTALTIVVQDGKTNAFYSIPLKTDAGYEPALFLGDFTGNGVDDIFIRINSGGSGGFGYFYVYSFANNLANILFDYEVFNGENRYAVIYEDQYKVNVINETMNLTSTIDLSNRDPEYLADLYNSDGTLIQPREGWVSDLNQLYPVDFDGDGVYELYALQRVIGQYNADGLGLVQTPLSWDKNKFQSFFDNQYVAVLGQPYR